MYHNLDQLTGASRDKLLECGMLNDSRAVVHVGVFERAGTPAALLLLYMLSMAGDASAAALYLDLDELRWCALPTAYAAMGPPLLRGVRAVAAPMLLRERGTSTGLGSSALSGGGLYSMPASAAAAAAAPMVEGGARLRLDERRPVDRADRGRDVERARGAGEL